MYITIAKMRGKVQIMNRKIFLITTVLLVSNVAMAYDLQVRKTSPKITRSASQKISSRVEEYLKAKGLESEVARELSRMVFSTSESSTKKMIGNITSTYRIVSEEELLDFVATKALHKQCIDLSSYATLIALVLHVNGGELTKERLNLLQEISKQNSALLV